MSPFQRAIALVSLVLVCSTPTRAADAPDPAVDTLVSQLAHDDFKRRDAAARELLTKGETARPALLAARKTQRDPEVAARVEGILAKLDAIAQRKGLVVEVDPPAGPFAAGEPVVLKARLRNTGKEPVTILRPIDGSDVGWRVVSYQWVITHGDRQPPVTRRGIGRCGNVNPLVADDRVTLQPGESYSPAGFFAQVGTYYTLAPGTYRASLAYAFDPARRDKGLPLGQNAPGVLEGVLAVAAASEPVEVTVADAPRAAAPAPAEGDAAR